MQIYSQRKVINILLGISLIFLTATCIFTYMQMQKLIIANSWVTHTYQIISVVNNLVRSVNDVKGSVSGYIMTGDKNQLVSINKDFQNIHKNLAVLKQLTSNNPIQQLRINKLEPLLSERESVVKQIMSTHDLQYMQTFFSQLNKKRLTLVNQILMSLDTINNDELILLQQRVAVYNQSVKTSNLTLISSLLLSELLFIISFILLNHHLAIREKIEQEQLKIKRKLIELYHSLQESEDRLMLASEGGKVGLWDWNPSKNKMYYSPYLRQMLGYPYIEFPDEMNSLNKILHPSDYERVWSLINEHLRDPSKPFNTEFRLKMKTGEYHWFQAMAVYKTYEDESHMSGALLDISERKKSQQQMEIHYGLTKMLGEADDWKKAIPKILEIICTNLSWEIGALWLVEESKEFLYCAEVWTAEDIRSKAFGEMTLATKFKFGTVLPGKVWQDEKPYWITDVTEYTGFTRLAQAKKINLHSAFAVPIILKDHLIGVLEFFTQGKQLQDDELMNFMSSVGNQIALFIERKHVEQEFQKISAHNAAILDSANDIIITTTVDGKILSANLQATKTFGYMINELINMNINELIYHATLKIHELTNASVVEFTAINKSGVKFPVEISLSSFSADEKRLVVIIRDITERRRSEALLKRSEEQFKVLVTGIRDYAIIMLDPRGCITTWNYGAEVMQGYSEEEVIGKHFSIFYTQKDRENKHPDYVLRKTRELGRYEEESWIVHKDGFNFWASVALSSIHDEKANFLGFAMVSRDLTEHKKIEILKNEFISVVSHELRTPITSIRGSLGLVLGAAAGEISDKSKKMLEIASNNCDRLVNLINDILDVEKLETGKMKFQFQICDLNKLLTEAISINAMYAEKFGVQIESTEHIHDVTVNVDPDRLTQVITNLLSNAIKFSKPGGKVFISLVKHGSFARFSVIDQGPGIPDEFQSKIFQKFSQADASSTRNKGGTGLGLAISKAIIERLGGTLNYHSEKDKGTEFYFDLPLVSEKRAEPSPIKDTDVNRLLLCEDDEDQAAHLSALLQQAGYAVDIGYTALQTKKLLNERNYQALLLDLVLPDMNGIELIRELRKSRQGEKIPIIVVSIIAEESKKMFNGNAIEVVDWLNKPIDFNNLLNAIALIKEHKKQVKPRILHIEDDIDIQKIVQNLLSETCDVVTCATLASARQLLAKESYNIVILDLLLSDGNGIELLPLIAEYKIPVVIFAQGELDPEYAQYVKQVLVKSKNSPQKLLEIIHNILKVEKFESSH